MRSTAGPAPRHTGGLIAGLIAIPVLSVSAAAMAADVASTTEPSAALWSAVALMTGVAAGAVALRVARAVARGVTTVLDRFVVAVAVLDVTGPAAVGVFSVVPAARPVAAFVPACTGRRGPPPFGE